MWPCGVERPVASNVNYVSGSVIPNGVIATIGSQGSVCFYSKSDTDLIVDVAGWLEGTAYVGSTPTRLADTRDGTGGVLARIDSDNPLTVEVTNLPVFDAAGTATTIPASVNAVALNVTAVSPSAAGFITVYPCDVVRPLSSNLNYTQNQVVANGVVSTVGTSGSICIYSSASTDVIIDLAGWFPSQAFTGSKPTRLVDTRSGTGGKLGALLPTDELSVPVHNITLNVEGTNQVVPVTATAAALNVTIVSPSAAGFATIWPCGISRPLSSNLNFVNGQVVANNIVAPIGNEGSICVYSSASTDIIVDIAGWFASDDGGAFIGTTPERLIDTRVATGPSPQ